MGRGLCGMPRKARDDRGPPLFEGRCAVDALIEAGVRSRGRHRPLQPVKLKAGVHQGVHHASRSDKRESPV